jgi:hypothetical protein
VVGFETLHFSGNPHTIRASRPHMTSGVSYSPKGLFMPLPLWAPAPPPSPPDAPAQRLVFRELPPLDLTASPIPPRPPHCRHVSQRRMGNRPIRMERHPHRNGFFFDRDLIVTREGRDDREESLSVAIDRKPWTLRAAIVKCLSSAGISCHSLNTWNTDRPARAEIETCSSEPNRSACVEGRKL